MKTIRVRFLVFALGVALLSVPMVDRVPADDPIPLDTVALQSGGVLEGRVTETQVDNRTIYVVVCADGSTFKFTKDQVKFVRRPKPAYAEYVVKKSQMADTVDAHWEMSEWCKENLDTRQSNGPNELGPERVYHLRAIVKLDPDHTQARALLGYYKENGVWINLEQQRLGHGFVQKDRRWVTREEIAMEMAEEAWKEQQRAWTRKLKKLRSSSGGQVLAELSKISDPAAAEPLIEMLKTESSSDWQLALVDTIGNIPSAAALHALCDVAVTHRDQIVRERGISRIKQNHYDPAAATKYVVRRYLSEKNNDMINSAGYVLGQIGDVGAVLPLIDAVRTKHTVVNPRARNPGSIAPSFSKDGSMGLQQGSSEPATLTGMKDNPAVLDALRSITKANFDYDKDRWKAWYTEQYTLIDVEVGRDD